MVGSLLVILGVGFAVSFAVFSKGAHNIAVSRARAEVVDAAAAEGNVKSSTGTFTGDPSLLEQNGFRPDSNVQILVAYAETGGYCIVGGHTGTGSWYLNDSNAGAGNITEYASQSDAEAGCSVSNVSPFAPIS